MSLSSYVSSLATRVAQEFKTVRTEVNALVPAGTLSQYAGSSAPSGYLLCQGQAVSRTTYSKLFAIVGTTYGTGDNSTTFNLPDLRGRVPVGLNGSDTDFDALNDKGGAKTHTLTTAQMPSHNHTQSAHNHGITDPGHSHSAGGYFVSSFPGYGQNSAINGYSVNPSWAGIGSATTGISINNATPAIQSTGGGEAHNNLQPFIVLNFIIKT